MLNNYKLMLLVSIERVMESGNGGGSMMLLGGRFKGYRTCGAGQGTRSGILVSGMYPLFDLMIQSLIRRIPLNYLI